VTPLRVAVVGSGVSGLTAAHVLARSHDVTLFERDGRLGGHANTVSVTTAGGRRIGLDTGFIVHNRRTYPNLVRLFDELGVRTQPSDMSFSVRCEGCGLEYAGARGLAGVVPRLSHAARPAYLRMLHEITRFHRHGRRLLVDRAADGLTFGEFLDRGGYSAYFRRHFALPLTGAIWSAPGAAMEAFPARHLIRFFANHGMLGVKGSPPWRTVTGGSRAYVDAVARGLGGRVRTGCPVVSVARDASGVTLVDGTGDEHRFAGLVIATHPDQALAMLADASDDERDVLGRFAYRTNDTVLHTDPSLLPRTRGARSSWNSLLEGCTASEPAVHVTYDLNRLQALCEPEAYCVTLNQTARIAPGRTLARIAYRHPIYTVGTPAAQPLLARLNGVRNTAYCGAYQGFGFHEDGCASGIRAAAAFGGRW
jgi:predicted NAD/FAD-binding protein